MEYLNKMALETNPSSFIKLIEFISLFREYVNKKINIKNENPENLPPPIYVGDGLAGQPKLATKCFVMPTLRSTTVS